MDANDLIEFERLKHRIEVLTERNEGLGQQVKRLVSHAESEQRVYNGTSKRVDMIEKLFDGQQKLIEKIDGIVRNGGGGLQLRVDRIEQREKDNNNRTDRWIAIAGVVMALISIAMQMLKT